MATAVPLVRQNPDRSPPDGSPPGSHPHSPSTPVERQMPGTSGTYLTYVGGYLSGTGTSKVGGGAVILTASVNTADGVSATLSAGNLSLTGDHFVGTGTVTGLAPFDIVGRLDGYKNDANFNGARILAYYTDNNGHNGKIGGVIVP